MAPMAQRQSVPVKTGNAHDVLVNKKVTFKSIIIVRDW